MINQKPLQRLSWSEKTAKDYAYFKETARYYLSLCTFRGTENSSSSKDKMRTMYEVYNSKIPASWFKHITDPLSAQDPKHANFPAKIRPTNILRTNLDLLMSEFKHRPFTKHRVENIGESGYNQFLEEMNNAIHMNLQEWFVAAAQEEMGEEVDPASIPLPQEIQEAFASSYKDKQAIKGQKWMKRAFLEYQFKPKFLDMFKDWLLAGEAISLKDVQRGNLVYERISPLNVDYDKAEDTKYIEDGEWAVVLTHKTLSDIIDEFYDELDESEHVKLEQLYGKSSPSVFYNHVNGLSLGSDSNKIPVYRVYWKGKKQIGEATFIDPTTGQEESSLVDEEEFSLVPPETKVKKMWVNEVYTTTMLGDSNDAIFMNMKPVTCQRNAMNNYSTTKLPINGRKFSDTHAENISVAQLGIPYLVMYIIVTRTLELTIAKSKGKILLIDKNVIPKKHGWTEEKFFYYAEALGYGLLDRNQVGADKSYNQYQVVDLSLYDNIKQLIELQQHFKQEWDDILGITRQRKGQTFATDTVGANQQALTQSTMITEMIYAGFEDFITSELQGLLDLSKFVNINGVRRLYNGTELDDMLLEIDPVAYMSADLGIFATQNSEDYVPLEMMKAQAQNMIQNNTAPSTVLQILSADNIADLEAKLKTIEKLAAEAAQQGAQSEQEAEAAANEMKMQFMEYEKMLEEQLIHTEYDRKEDLQHIQGQYSIASFQAPVDADNNGVPDAVDIMKRQTEMDKIASNERMQEKDLRAKERMEKMKTVLQINQKERESKRKAETDKYKANKQAKSRTKTSKK